MIMDSDRESPRESEEADPTEGTFLVTYTDMDTDSAVLRDVETGQIHTLSSVPSGDAAESIETGDVLTGTLVEDRPLGVTWTIETIDDHEPITLERSEEAPTAQDHSIAADQGIGELTVEERAGVGELHVITVEPGATEEAADDVVDDEATIVRAARLGVARVVVRTNDSAGIVSVRYLP